MKQAIRFIAIFLLGIILIVGLFTFYLTTESGQNFVSKRVGSYLEETLQTKVRADIHYSFPDWVSLENIYIEDQRKDTLLSGNKIHADLDMWELINNRAVKIDKILAENIILKLNRRDKTFNYQFILDAFTTKETTPKDTAAININLSLIDLKRIRVDYVDEQQNNKLLVFLKQFNTKFDKIDIEKNQYFLNDITLDGLNLAGNLTSSTDSTLKDTTQSASPPLDFRFSTFNLLNSSYALNFDKKTTAGKFSNLLVKAKQINLPKNIFEIENAVLKKSDLTYEDNSKPRQKGFDANHIILKDVDFSIENIAYEADTINAKVNNLTFIEQNGLNLQVFKGFVNYTPKNITLREFMLKTPQTTLQNQLDLRFASLDALANRIGETKLNVALRNSKLSMKDLLWLLPDLRNNLEIRKVQNETFAINGTASGRINDLNLNNLIVSGLNNTLLALNGNLKNLPNTDKLLFDLNVSKFNVRKETYLKFIPKSSIPTAIELPSFINLAGKLKGSFSNLVANAHVLTDFGKATFNGNVKADAVVGKVGFQNFNLGKFIKQPEKIGEVSLTTDLVLKNFDLNQMQVDAKGYIDRAVFNNYAYQNVNFEAVMRNKILNLKTFSDDPNLALNLETQIDLNNPYAALSGKTSVRNLDLRKLNFTTDSLSFSGDVVFDIMDSNPEAFKGTITASNSVIYQGKRKIELGDLFVNIVPQTTGKGILGDIKTSFANINFSTTTSQTEIFNAVMTEVNRYFALPSIAYTPYLQPYQFQINGYVKNHPALQAFMPTLKRLDSLYFKGKIDSHNADTTLKFYANLPYAKLDSNGIKGLKLDVVGNGKQALYNADLQEYLKGDTRIRRANLRGDVENNLADFNFSVRDSLNKPIHGVAGNLKSQNQHILIGFNPSGNLVNYESWRANSEGQIDYSDAGIIVRNLVLTAENQSLHLNSQRDEPNSPINILADNLDLQKLMVVAVQDSTIADGKISGAGTFSLQNNTFTGDFKILDFTVKQIPIGDLTTNLSNEQADRIRAIGTLKGAGNDVDLAGNYFINRANPLDLVLNIRTLNAKTIEAFSFGLLEKTRGSLDGKLSITGNTDNLKFNGTTKFHEFVFTLPLTQATYQIDEQTLLFEGENVLLRNVTIKDSLGRDMLADGIVNIGKLPDFSYNINIKSDNFLALNTSRKDNDFLFGKAFINPLLNVQGTNEHYKVNGKVRLNSGTEMTMLMPDNVGSEESKDGVVQFVNVKEEGLNKPKPKTSDEARKVKSAMTGELNINLEADQSSELKIIIDELNGDYLKARGVANLTTEINDAGEMNMLGYYRISEGTYEMTYQFIKKPFTIRPGSEITWTGDPLKGTLDITAEYTLRTSLGELTADADKKTLLKNEVPLRVKLILTGELLTPQVSFRVDIDENFSNSLSGELKSTVDVILADLNNNKTELNKQVFGLLAFNRFISGTDQFGSLLSNDGAEALARQSLSKLFSQQLNSLAGNIIKGVKLDFNLASEYNASSDFRSTNLGVGLSKSFFDDRISISVGRNFELENAQVRSNEIFDNINFTYNLTKDGRLRFRAFRRNQLILEGFVVETGLGFTVTLEFDKFRELIGIKDPTPILNRRREKMEKSEAN